MIASLAVLVALGAGPALAETITIEEARYGGQGRFCSAVEFFAERCAGQEACTVEITPDTEPCEVPGSVEAKIVELRYRCGGSTNAVTASGNSLLRLGCSSVAVQSR